MSDSNSLWIIPEAPVAADSDSKLQRRAQGGLRIGILDNSKSNADHLLRMIADDIKAKVPVASITSLRKPSPAAGAEAALLERLAKETDFVISAMAD